MCKRICLSCKSENINNIDFSTLNHAHDLITGARLLYERVDNNNIETNIIVLYCDDCKKYSAIYLPALREVDENVYNSKKWKETDATITILIGSTLRGSDDDYCNFYIDALCHLAEPIIISRADCIVIEANKLFKDQSTTLTSVNV